MRFSYGTSCVVEFNPDLHGRVTRGPEAVAAQAELSKSVQDAVVSLPEAYSVPLVLRYAEGLTYAEIAEIMEVPLGTVKTYIHRARSELRGTLSHLRC